MRAMIGLLKKSFAICKLGWREIRNALPVFEYVGVQRKDLGVVSQTLLTGKKLRLQRSLGELGDVQMVNSQNSLHPRDIVKSCLFVMPYKLHLLMTTLPIFSTDGLEKTA